MTNPQIENLEKVATILAGVRERFVFTGGGTIVLYVDEIIKDELRPTKKDNNFIRIRFSVFDDLSFSVITEISDYASKFRQLPQ